VADVRVRLQPVREQDLDLLERFAVDPAFSEPFEWGGFRSAEALRHRWETDTFLDSEPHYLAVVDESGSALGWVMWEEGYRGLGGNGVWVVGILLAPEHRGRGVGTVAQRLLAEYLFETTRAHRLLAFTESDNTTEQHALEKCGFQREGVFRKGGFRGGEWRDVCAYGLLREEFKPPSGR
jgi:RimJ/RimL family protein N-acetyltransferase